MGLQCQVQNQQHLHLVVEVHPHLHQMLDWLELWPALSQRGRAKLVIVVSSDCISTLRLYINIVVDDEDENDDW